MTRKDYELIAKVINDYQAYALQFEGGAWRNVALAELVPRLSEALEKDNSRFNRNTFADACFGPKV